MNIESNNIAPALASRFKELIREAGGTARHQRGRTKAKDGGVRGWTADQQGITAQVTGSNSNTYLVQYNPKLVTTEQRQMSMQVLLDEPLYLAQLMNGHFSKELYEDLTSLGISILPDNLLAGRKTCSCLDQAVPCKHIFALYYQLLVEMEDNPLVFFSMLGMDQREVVDQFQRKWLPSHYSLPTEGQNSTAFPFVTSSEMERTAPREEVRKDQHEGSIFLRRSVDNGTYFQTKIPDSLLNLPVKSEETLPEQSLLIWGPPVFAQRNGNIVTGALQEVYRIIAKKAGEERKDLS
ncbi:SWIM zinc finger family protein [Brevibacillus daliensis]|uniref:SWIM zinc finger family protein n=1 Tax=Brevibacillus daliensis TaxID=2892995 RepID=UPI001E2AB04E|nr:SWIM zinc finger family protein [Brevibacillus daliensis]